MILYPDIYLKNVKEITMELLIKNNIKALILDVDNTLIDFNKVMLEGVKEWVDDMKQNNIKLFILSNTNKREKVKKVALILDIPYINFAKKPCKSGFKKVVELLKINNDNIGVVGDQIMTDILGGNRMKMFTILTKPLNKKDIWITKLKRPIENIIIKSYIRSIEKEQEKKDVF